MANNGLSGYIDTKGTENREQGTEDFHTRNVIDKIQPLVERVYRYWVFKT